MPLLDYGVVAQSMPLIAAVSAGAVLLHSGWAGFTTLFLGYVCTFFCCLFAQLFCAIDYRPGDELPYLTIGAIIGCFLGIRAARRVNLIFEYNHDNTAKNESPDHETHNVGPTGP